MPDRAFVDIHCHLLPGLDDGSQSWAETLEMARLAEADGVAAVIATPHQLGGYCENHGDTIRRLARQTQDYLNQQGVQLRVAPGGDVRIEPKMVSLLREGSVLTLGDQRRHVLLELPHELYFDMQPVLRRLREVGIVGVLSHPERNQGLIRDPGPLAELVRSGCLMQITAGSFLGGFGEPSQRLAEWMLERRLVHFVASDGHGVRRRRPLMGRAFQRVAELAGIQVAEALCCVNPQAVLEGRNIPRIPWPSQTKTPWWAVWRRAA